MGERISYTSILGFVLLIAAGCGDAGNDAPNPTASSPTTVSGSGLSDSGLSNGAPSVAIASADAGLPSSSVDATVFSPTDASVLLPVDSSSTTAASVDSGSGSGPGPGPTSSKKPSKLPTASGPCPEFTSGDVMFAPSGVTARKVRLWVGTKSGGPLIFYWHGTGSQPSEAQVGLSGVLPTITEQGGVVAALYTGANEGQFPWLQTTAEALTIADDVVGCAIMKKQIDTGRIHAIGMSAGGLMAANMGLGRSNYIASVVPYSGGSSGIPQANQDPSNKFAALLFHGGTADDVFGLNFKMASENYSATLRRNGNFTILCDHGMGHRIPGPGAAAAWRFFQDHPFGTTPSPYAGKPLPAPIPSYCMAAP